MVNLDKYIKRLLFALRQIKHIDIKYNTMQIYSPKLQTYLDNYYVYVKEDANTTYALVLHTTKKADLVKYLANLYNGENGKKEGTEDDGRRIQRAV